MYPRLLPLLGALLAAPLACSAGAILADVEYVESPAWSYGGARGHIVALGGGMVFNDYATLRLHYMKDAHSAALPVDDLPDADVYDVVMVPSGGIWVATAKGLVSYTSVLANAKATAVTDRCILSLAVSAKGTLFVVDDSDSLFHLREKTLVRVPGMKVRRLAFSRDGTMFYTSDWTGFIYRKLRGAANYPTPLKGVQLGSTNLLEVNRKTDVLYICHSDGLFRVAPGGTEALRLESNGDSVTALGFVFSRQMFLGRVDEIVRIELVSITPANWSAGV